MPRREKVPGEKGGRVLVTSESPPPRQLLNPDLWHWEDFKVRDPKTGKMMKRKRKVKGKRR